MKYPMLVLREVGAAASTSTTVVEEE